MRATRGISGQDRKSARAEFSGCSPESVLRLSNRKGRRHTVADESYSTETRFATRPGETKNEKYSKALEDIKERLEKLTTDFDSWGKELKSINRTVQTIAEDLRR
jgi:archaellum component FlaC